MTYASTAHGLPGVFISFEGGEGVGKTTQITFMERVLKNAGLDVVRLREPGGTKVGEDLRAIVLDAKNDMLDDRAELFIYEAARAQIVAEVIRPALERGAVVLCDRFVDSTVAYQGYGRGLDPAFVRQANEFACQGILPDRTVLLTVDSTALGLKRATRRLGADRLELAGSEFHQRVNEGFKRIAADHPERVRTVSSGTTKSAAARGVWDAVGDVLAEAFGVERPSEAEFDALDRRRHRRQNGGRKGGPGSPRQSAYGPNGRARGEAGGKRAGASDSGAEGRPGRDGAGRQAGGACSADDGAVSPSGAKRRRRGGRGRKRAGGTGARRPAAGDAGGAGA